MVTLGGQVWLERRVVVVGVRTGKGNLLDLTPSALAFRRSKRGS